MNDKEGSVNHLTPTHDWQEMSAGAHNRFVKKNVFVNDV
jgi:hypothetical protein